MPRAEVSVADDSGRVRRVREFLAEKAERDLARLPADCDIYDFGGERDRQLERLADLKARRPVTVYGWQIRAALRPPGTVPSRLYTVGAKAITPAVVERR